MTKLSNAKNEVFKTNPYGEKYLYSINRHTFEKESSNSVYKRHFGKQFEKEETLYLIFGTDSGLLTKFIFEQEKPKNTRFLFIELPHVIEQIKQALPTDYDKESFSFTTPEKWKEDAEAFEISLYIYKENICYIKSLAVVNAYWLEYHSTNQDIIRALEAFFFFTRATVGVYPYMTRQLMNISENNYSSNLLDNVFSGKTCAILGGGPSLDDEIQWLKDNQKNIVIIAVSRIAKTLIRHKLTPHIIVSVDPYNVSFDVSKELLQLPEQVLFLHANCVTPDLLSQWHGRSVCMGPKFPWEDETDLNCSRMSGPTVTNTALKAAIEMGFSNILLSGVDLCNSITGVSHASGSNEARVGPILGQHGVYVETYAGNKAETSIAFDTAILALSGQAKQVKDKGVCIYNLSKNAAKAEHIEHIPTSGLYFDQEEEDIWHKIHSSLPKINRTLIREYNNSILNKVSKVLKDIQKIKRLAEEALECNKSLFSVKGKESENYKYKLRMDKIEKKISVTYKKTEVFVKNFGLDKFIKSAQTSHDDWSDDKVEETGRLYYQAYIDSSNTLVKLLKSCTERIKSRIEEEKDSPNFDIIFKQWQKDKHFGRAQSWLNNNRHQSIQLTDVIKVNINEQIAKFEKVLNDDESPHLARTRKEASLTGVRRKIIVLFHQNNIDGLNVLAKSLSIYEGNEDNKKLAEELSILAHAFYFVVTGKEAEAMEFFEKTNPDEIKEDELQQIASLALKLKNYDKAEWAFMRLSDLSSIYTSQYAKILKLLGKVEQSINCYTEYLAENAEDVQAWISLGKLYDDINAVDSAKMAFEYVLAKEPNNHIALEYLGKSL
jgi:tetratricopeptide (TPR) repeat protein